MDRDEREEEEPGAQAAPSPRIRTWSDDPARDAVLRVFLDAGGRLISMPAKMGKRRFVLEHVVCAFEPGMKYPELEVNAILRSFYDDYVTLRRYLIDAGLMAREDGIYWRTGGYVAV